MTKHDLSPIQKPLADSVTTISIEKDYLHFSAAHFTLFSDTKRENLHGHNFFVTCEVDALVGEDGLCFDYQILKDHLNNLCTSLDERVLLPQASPFLAFEQDGNYLTVKFNNERMAFLHRDVLLLPVRNITIEELAAWFLKETRSNKNIHKLAILRLQIKISSGPGQWASSEWKKV